MSRLLAIDLGLRCGMALYDAGRLQWYRSTNFGSTARLKRAIPGIFREANDPQFLVVEGGGRLMLPWRRHAERAGTAIMETDALTWRKDLLLDRQQRNASDAKENAIKMASKAIDWAGAPSPTAPVRHDTAEAILLGLWACHRVGMIDELPRLT